MSYNPSVQLLRSATKKSYKYVALATLLGGSLNSFATDCRHLLLEEGARQMQARAHPLSKDAYLARLRAANEELERLVNAAPLLSRIDAARVDPKQRPGLTDRLAIVSPIAQILSLEKNVQVDQGNGKFQGSPFHSFALPLGDTGFYFPNKGDFASGAHRFPFEPDNIILMMPGQGSNRSMATSLMPIFSKFLSSKNMPQLAGTERKMRVLPIALDSTLGGMQKEGPHYMSAPDVSVELLHHMVLIMKVMFPTANIFLTGRSQGAMQAMEYATVKKGFVSGVISVGSNHPDREVMQHVLQVHESPEIVAKILTSGTEINPFVWHSMAAHTPDFRFFQHKPNCPLLIMAGGQDISYPMARYRQVFKDYESAYPDMIRFLYFDNWEHNLWDARNIQVFNYAFNLMNEFMAAHIRVP